MTWPNISFSQLSISRKIHPWCGPSCDTKSKVREIQTSLPKICKKFHFQNKQQQLDSKKYILCRKHSKQRTLDRGVQKFQGRPVRHEAQSSNIVALASGHLLSKINTTYIFEQLCLPSSPCEVYCLPMHLATILLSILKIVNGLD